MASNPNPEAENGSYFQQLLRTDPIQLQGLVNKYVRIETIDGTERFGFVYTVDPVTKSYVLMKSGEAETSKVVEIIPGCSVRNVEQIPEPDNKVQMFDLDEVVTEKRQIASNAEIKERKSQIIAWFHKHFIKLEVSPHDSSVLVLQDALTIRPPYDLNDCLSNNEIILAKMTALLKVMPKDFNRT